MSMYVYINMYIINNADIFAHTYVIHMYCYYRSQLTQKYQNCVEEHDISQYLCLNIGFGSTIQ